jgi:outer membrane protein assembly factor BamA
MRFYATYIIATLLASLVLGQGGSYPLHVQPDSVIKKAHLSTLFASRQAAEVYVSGLLSRLQAAGYWSASIDAANFDSTAGLLILFLGERYQWAPVPLPAPYAALLQNGGRTRRRSAANTNPVLLQASLLNYFCNHGFPFATVALDSMHLLGSRLTGRWVVQAGLPYRFDSLQQRGPAKLNDAYLYRYLHLQPGMRYAADLVNSIDQRLAELNFVEMVQPTDLRMLASGATAELYLRPRRGNVINVLLGLMPASTQTPNNKLQITGEANILLRNAFANGESIGINWQQYKSPRVNLSFQQPFLFGSALGADLAFDLLKKDTQFLTLNFRLGTPVQLSHRASAKVFFQQFSTTVGSADTALVLLTRRLPAVANLSSSNLGLEYAWQATDYSANPRRGWQTYVSVLSGLKGIRRDANLVSLKDPADPSFDFGTLYDSLPQNGYQLRVLAKVARFLALGSQSTVKLGMQGGWLQTNSYFTNELFQIGGFRLLRGFDEESIFARGYVVATAEYRLLAGRNGYFFGFLDAAWAQYKATNLQVAHQYLGTGLGLNLDTKNSVINLSLAIGARNGQPINFRQGKIHLGIVNYF